MLNAIIFDMDGTLFQTNTILELSLEDAFQRLRDKNLWNEKTPIEKYRDIMGIPLPQVWEALLPQHSKEVRAETDAYFLERLVGNIRNGKGALYPYVTEILPLLKENGYSIFIASNGLPTYLKAIVKYYTLDKWVTETFSIAQIDTLDKADLVKLVVDKYNISSGAVVGDRLSDIQAAKANDLLAIGCNFDFAKEKELVQADKVIDNLRELHTVLAPY
ncbi:HAD family hydrolase [Niallia taxi]|uniref:HAD family hydrolase n=1 Tax=Niallia taxi TaxID=2499688 RepID=A0A437KFW9_9BACI|nr:HAD family hydrolase [Niallia taxi]MDK8642589.1 HAD hydrolase-like protein [Niallia taxi]RVT66990.1 HAD family hydrolase [Niallia taxi]